MKKILALAASCLLLASCDVGTGAADGYTFEKGNELLLPERDVKVILYPTNAALQDSYKLRKGGRVLSPGEELFGFSTINRTTCYIHTIDPAVSYKPEAIGHEMTHCLFGEFHPNQNQRG